MMTCALDGTICFIEMNKFTVTRTFYGHCSATVQSLYGAGSGGHGSGSARGSAATSRATTARSQSRMSADRPNSKVTAAAEAKDYAAKAKTLLSADNDSVCTMGFSRLGETETTGRFNGIPCTDSLFPSPFSQANTLLAAADVAS